MQKLSDQIKPILAMSIVLLGFIYFFMTTFTETKPNDQILIAIVGLMGGASGYYFGSSSGNAKKDEIIQNNINENSKN
jgi:ABC-type enterochelin transport system permease subunit